VEMLAADILCIRNVRNVIKIHSSVSGKAMLSPIPLRPPADEIEMSGSTPLAPGRGRGRATSLVSLCGGAHKLVNSAILNRNEAAALSLGTGVQMSRPGLCARGRKIVKRPRL
jgi:hypothetical protein